MNRNSKQHAEELNMKRNRRTRRQRVLSVLASITVFCTTYALIIPALTIENDQLNKAQYMLASEVENTTGAAITAAETEEIAAEEIIAEEIAAAVENTTGAAITVAETEEGEELAEEIIEGEELTEGEVIAEAVEETEIRATAEDGAEVVITGVLPEDAEATIFPVVFDDEELIAYFGEELAASMKGFVAYDITIWSNGEEWQPDESVNVQVLQPVIELAEEDTINAVHFEETEEETTITEVAANVTVDGAIEFPAEGFSIYAFYTVDFHDDDVTFSIEGDTSVLLSEVFENLGLELDAAQVVSATFSDETLVAVEPVMDDEENIIDWTLTSLAPFDTEETLTLVFADGSEKVIVVTDANNTTITVTATWRDGEEPESESINITLYRNGSRTTKTAVLSKSNNWTATFTGLESGTYTVDYQDIEGYSSEVSENKTESDIWSSVTSLTSGNTYVFVQGSNTKRALQNSADSALSRSSGLTIENNKITSTVSDEMQWVYTNNKGVNSFKSVKTGRYLKLDGNGAGTASSTGDSTNVSYGNGKFSRYFKYDNNRNTYYLNWDSNSYKISTSGTTFTPYEKSTAVTSTFTIASEKEQGEAELSKTVRLVAGTTYSDVDAVIGGTWTSSNTSAATVNEDGIITAVAEGSSTITHVYEVTEGNVTTTYTYVYNIIVTSTADVDPSDSTFFPIHKQIDYLGDGQDNTDTTVDNGSTDTKDLYRLYLDMTGKQEPVDLVVVVDGSGSMRDNSDVDGMRRDYAVTKFLNGNSITKSGSRYTVSKVPTTDGFISFFLDLNPENRISVVQFYGDKSASRNSNQVTSSARSYTADSEILLDWTSAATYSVDAAHYVDCEAITGAGTNYEAGLKRATEVLDSRTSTEGHKTMVIFMSDGVPTFFMIDQTDVGTKLTNSVNYTISSNDVGKRWGTGNDGSVNDAGKLNAADCVEPSKQAVDDFAKDNPGVTMIAVGVSSAIDVNDPESSQNPEILKYMASKTNGVAMSVTESMDSLQETLRSIFYPQGVIITDNLSKYVSYYAAQPDVLVTMKQTNPDSATADGDHILYQNGQVTEYAKTDHILDSVTFTAKDTSEAPTGSTGTVTANFNSDYQFSPDYVYTLSFNVEVTKTAYDEYRADNYNAEGDDNTDHYNEKKTSSLFDGFYSNDSATVSYSVTSGRFEQIYHKPVVQVDAERVVLRKIVDSVNTSGEFSFNVSYTDVDGNSQTETVDLKHYTGTSRQATFLVKKGTAITITEESSGYDVAYQIDEINDNVNPTGYTSGKVCTIDSVDDATIVWFRNTPADMSQFIKVQKKFVGITADQIPADFQVTVTSKSDASKTFTLKKSGAVVSRDNSTDTTILTWTLNGVGLGQYSITEDNYGISGYSVTAKGTGETVEVTAAKLKVECDEFETTCKHTNWPVNINGDANVLFAATLTDQGVAVISRYPLSESEKENVRQLVTSFKQGTWIDPVYFYSVQEQIESGEGLVINNATITYDFEKGEVLIGDKSNWQMCATCRFSVSEAANNPEIQIINTYTAGYELPSTGGIGTTIFYVVGGILLVGAVVLLVTKKRMESEDEEK